MNLKNLNRKELKDQILNLMDEVNLILEKKIDVDDFLEETNLFDDWELILPDSEYPIFIISVLNNIRRDIIIDSILDSVFLHCAQIAEKEAIIKKDIKDPFEHPFC